MSTRTRNFQPTRYKAHRHSITGTLAATAVMGMVIVRASDGSDTVELADGQAGYFLDRDVVTAAELKAAIEANELRPDSQYFEYPYTEDGAVTGEEFDEVWVEGDALDASIDVDTAVGSRVTTSSGKIAELTDATAQETQGIVRANIEAINGTGRRLLIEVIRGSVES